MKKHRWQLFCLHLSFIGWFLLGFLTLGIGFLFATPYKNAAEAAQNAAIESARKEWEANTPKPNVLESEEYKKLLGEFDGYKAKQTARNSAEFAGIKPKFFDRVYELIDRADGAKPVTEQLADLKKDYEEYFNPADPTPNKPQFGAKPEGSMPKGEEGAVAAFTNAWGFSPKKT